MARGDGPRTGALTDGLQWWIWHNNNGNWFADVFTTESLDEALRVLSIPLWNFVDLITRNACSSCGGKGSNNK